MLVERPASVRLPGAVLNHAPLQMLLTTSPRISHGVAVEAS